MTLERRVLAGRVGTCTSSLGEDQPPPSWASPPVPPAEPCVGRCYRNSLLQPPLSPTAQPPTHAESELRGGCESAVSTLAAQACLLLEDGQVRTCLCNSCSRLAGRIAGCLTTLLQAGGVVSLRVGGAGDALEGCLRYFVAEKSCLYLDVNRPLLGIWAV